MTDDPREDLREREKTLKWQQRQAQAYYDQVKRRPDTLENSEELDRASAELDRIWVELKAVEEALRTPSTPE